MAGPGLVVVISAMSNAVLQSPLQSTINTRCVGVAKTFYTMNALTISAAAAHY